MSTSNQQEVSMDLQSEIKVREAELRDLHNRKRQSEHEARVERLQPLRILAERAHGLFCTHNHTDGCGWGYETDAADQDAIWACAAHERWLVVVEKILSGKRSRYPRPCSVEALTEILDGIENLKAAHRDAVWIVRWGFSFT